MKCPNCKKKLNVFKVKNPYTCPSCNEELIFKFDFKKSISLIIPLVIISVFIQHTFNIQQYKIILFLVPLALAQFIGFTFQLKNKIIAPEINNDDFKKIYINFFMIGVLSIAIISFILITFQKNKSKKLTVIYSGKNLDENSIREFLENDTDIQKMLNGKESEIIEYKNN
jgi:DNA-directed RNA polymerase subunit RPC12/RpoP